MLDMNDPNKALKANIMIHACAAASAVAAGAWASIPIVGPIGIIFGADTLFLTPLTIGMVVYIARLHGQSLKEAEISAGLGQVFAMILGVNAARALSAIFPGVGTTINAVIAFSLQETVGWGAYLLLERGGDIKDLHKFIGSNKATIEKMKEMQKAEAERIQLAISSLPADRKAEYEVLKSRFSQKNLSSSEKIETQERMSKIIEIAMSAE
ncbi:hypothetical protein [Synechococcus sp. BA-132 BA5]|uniref:hypothetical protein n=1 Tax=Synechococcus sp. BA-132 BA5 TaxID=3110252 RepID=UPI002B21DB8A|nr:hypothetical protein [Synechococcus sp. BA-132 BA5]MEA5414508.1 hypothetical protein [Synechococcus sp. BA-132 BA5]